MKRASGVLLPVFSLPSKYGIGCFSKEAYKFIDLLQEAGQSCWQLLPLGPTGYGDSPYQSFSTFAGNPYFIDLKTLIKEGLLTKKECKEYDFGENAGYIDYEKIYRARFKVLKKAYGRFQKDETACVSFDGDTPEHLHVGDRVRIAQAQSTIWICKISNQSFLEILRKKMRP